MIIVYCSILYSSYILHNKCISSPHALKVALVPLNDLEVVPDELAPGVLARVGQQGGADHGLGGISCSQRRLLADLTVLGAGVDGVHHHVVMLSVFLHLSLEDPRVGVHSNFGDSVGTGGPTSFSIIILKLRAVVLVLQDQAVKFLLREMGVSKLLLNSCPRY